MTPSQKQILQVLFDEGQASCFSDTTRGYKVSHAPKPEDEFFCINALHPYKDLNPTREWHDEFLPRRSDYNVVCYRNFLIELDNMPLQEQASYVMDKLPVTSVVYSGGKSLHFIISLTEPLPSLADYKIMSSRILELFPKADKSCKNASRLSRLPGVVRADTGRLQELRYLGQRVNMLELEPLLPKKRIQTSRIYSAHSSREYISTILIEACSFPDDFMEKHDICGRNALFYYIGKRLEESNLSLEKRESLVLRAYENLHDCSGFPIEEALAAARIQGDA